MEKMMITGMLLAGMFLFSVTQNKGNTEGVLVPQSQQSADVPTFVAPPISQMISPSVAKQKALTPTKLVALDSSPKKKDATFEVFVPTTGEVRKVTVIGQSQEEFDRNKKEDKKDCCTWAVETSEFRKNDKEWYTVLKKRNNKGAQVDSIDWTKKGDKYKEGRFDKNSNLLSDNDPNLKDFEDELLKDGLIKNPKQYELSLTRKRFSIGSDVIETVYAEKYKQLYKKLFAPTCDIQSEFNFYLIKRDTAKNGLLTYGRDDKPNPAKPGHCYAKCKGYNAETEEWREIICQDKVTKDFVHALIAKLKTSGDLAASVEADEVTKDIRNAIVAYQRKNKLPVGNLNLATMEHLDLNP